jgi:hypothetical protein
MTTPTIDIDAALTDANLLGAALGPAQSWTVWLSVLRAASGLPLNDEQRRAFATVAGNRPPPTRRVKEFWAVAGRGSGKSKTAAATATHAAVLQPHQLSPGEVGHVLVLSPTVAQAKIVFGYCKSYLEESPVLRQEIVDITQNEIRLRNNVVISTHPNSFRSVRGRTLLTVVLDEISFFRDESSATPDVEVYRAVLPSLIRTGGQLIGISTPYRRVGLLHQKHKNYFGVADDDVLVVQGSSTQFNTTLSEADIAKASADDPEASLSEWGGLFRTDISSLFDDATIDAAVEYGRPLELPPLGGRVTYGAFVDASGGVGKDSYTLSVGHREGELIIVDLVRGTVGKFDPVEITKTYAALLSEYGISSVVGDAYAAGWVSGAWGSVGVTYRRSELPKSQIYLETIPLFTRGLARLPDHPRLLRELRLLERKTHRSGKDSVDHGRNGTDDYANAVCGVMYALSNHLGYLPYEMWVSNNADEVVVPQPRPRLHPNLSDAEFRRIMHPPGLNGVSR